MNKKLKFSWGHIVAFLVLIFISYISFMGLTYSSDGDFTKAGLFTFGVLVILIVFFIGAQYMKGVDEKFHRSVKWERFFIFLSPIVFIVCMLPYSHFWTVQSNGNQISAQFDSAIVLSKNMFADYGTYSNNRIENYKSMLNRIAENKNLRPQEYRAIGFTSRDDASQIKLMVKELQLQLLSNNYDSLKTTAIEWIDGVQGTSVWNVFVIGNIKQIKQSMDSWNNDLSKFAKRRIKNEEFNGYNTVKEYSSHGKEIKAVETSLDNLKNLYTKSAKPNATAIISGLVCYLLLLFPYFIQKRNTKNIYRLFGMEKGMKNNNRDDYLEVSTMSKEEKPLINNNNEARQVPPKKENMGLHGTIRIN